MIQKIISGGQPGAEAGAIDAAKSLRIAVGGWTAGVPKLTLSVEYGLKIHSSAKVAPSLQSNMLEADGSLFVGALNLPCMYLPLRYAKNYRRPYYFLPWDGASLSAEPTAALTTAPTAAFVAWLRNYGITKLHVTGNREHRNPGIYNITKYFLLINLASKELSYAK